MIRKISFKLSVNAMLILLALVLCYHLLILFELIPYEIAWGGRLQNRSEMYVFETISIVINLFIFTIVLIKGIHKQTIIPAKVVTILLWIFTAIFTLNTIGNLFSINSIEMIIFTPLTFVSALFCYRMAIEKNGEE